MDKYYVMVVGSGQTTRPNLEALMEDHYYANGAGGVLLLPYTDKPSTAQIFAAQYAKDKNVKVVGISNKPSADEAHFSSLAIAEEPIEHAVFMMKGSTAASFILWNDDDPQSLEALALSLNEGIACFDLTAGLSPISNPGNIKLEEKPKFPVQETLPSATPSSHIDEEEYEDEDEEDIDDEDEDEDSEDEQVEEQVMDDLYFGIKALAKLIAKEITKELLEAQQKPSEGSEA